MTQYILVVDDESVTRRVVTYALKPLGLEVIGAENGAEALRSVQETQFALAIVDINVPDMDGFEIMRKLKALPHMAQTPIIMFTARNDPSDQSAALAHGAVDFLYKPFSTQELRDIVTKYLPSV